MKLRQICIVLVGIFALFTSSCRTTPMVGANGVTYYVQPRMDTSGYYQRVMITQSISKGVKASVAGLEDLDVKVTEKRGDQIIGQVKAEFADGKKVKITLQKNMGATEMRIYVGDMADKVRSHQIFQAISKHLK